MGNFNEREFEFCFNAEFVRKNTGALIGTPIIPSQRMENILGYGVEFRIRNGRYARSLYLQHKVSYYAQFKSGRNAPIWDCYYGPYYRFPISRLDRTRQHNLLVDLAEKGEDVFYCAPVFVGIGNLQTYFGQSVVMNNSRFFDAKEMGRLSDFEQHHVSCDPSGTFGFFHSDPVKLESVFNWDMLMKKTKKRRVTIEYISHLADSLSSSIFSVLEAKPSIPDDIREKGDVLIVSYLLRRYFSVEWLIMP